MAKYKDKAIKDLVPEVFSLDTDSFAILGAIALYEYRNKSQMEPKTRLEYKPVKNRIDNILLPNGGQGKCRKLVASDAYGDFKSNITEDALQDNSNMEHKFLMENYCLTCEYFQRCGLGCFLHSDYTERVELDDCVFKITFDYITKGIKHDEHRQ